VFLKLLRGRGPSRPAYAFLAALLLASQAASTAVAQENAPQGGDSIGNRLSRLEQKVNDLQVMVGTLESFVSTKPGAVLKQEMPAPAPRAQPSDLGPRIDALETQITALTSHIEQMGRQLSALEAKFGAAPSPQAAPPDGEPPPAERQGWAPSPTPPSGLASPEDSADDGDTSKSHWYGPKPGSDAMAALIEEQAAGQASPDSQPQSLAAGLPGGDAQSLYQQGYGALLQKDYAGAEGAFRRLLDTYPNDPLAGDAQYWVGETYYVRGQYKNAADAFLKGYKKYRGGQKAPDALLKLGMSLAELGQKDAACSTFNELKAKFPQAPEHIDDEAAAWRKKTGC
jgi:tol-pal system protein YbgF